MTLKRPIQQSNEKQKIDKRIERNTQSVLALRDFLREVLQEPATFTEDLLLLKALKSHWQIPRDEIEKYYRQRQRPRRTGKPSASTADISHKIA